MTVEKQESQVYTGCPWCGAQLLASEKMSNGYTTYTWYCGSSKCTKLGLKEAAYDDNEDELRTLLCRYNESQNLISEIATFTCKLMEFCKVELPFEQETLRSSLTGIVQARRGQLATIDDIIDEIDREDPKPRPKRGWELEVPGYAKQIVQPLSRPGLALDTRSVAFWLPIGFVEPIFPWVGHVDVVLSLCEPQSCTPQPRILFEKWHLSDASCSGRFLAYRSATRVS